MSKKEKKQKWNARATSSSSPELSGPIWPRYNPGLEYRVSKDPLFVAELRQVEQEIVGLPDDHPVRKIDFYRLAEFAPYRGKIAPPWETIKWYFTDGIHSDLKQTDFGEMDSKTHQGTGGAYLPTFPPGKASAAAVSQDIVEEGENRTSGARALPSNSGEPIVSGLVG